MQDLVAVPYLRRMSNALVALAGLVAAGPASADTAEEIANRTVAMALFAHIYNDKSYADAAELLGARFVQHTPTIADGRSGLEQHIERLRDEQPDSSRQIKRVLLGKDVTWRWLWASTTLP